MKIDVAKLAACLAVVALASGIAPALSKPEKGKVFGDWVIECEPGSDGAEQCFASQTQTKTEKDEKPVRLLKLSIGYIGPKGAPAMVAILPLGIFIPAGAAYQVDSGPQKPLLIQRCLPQGCIAATTVDERSLAALRRGNRLLLGVKTEASGQTMTIPVSLKGIDAAIKSLK